MAIELQILFGVCAYGAVQGLIAGRFKWAEQVHRNFSETVFVFVLPILCLASADGFGSWSFKGACAYAAGRGLYLLLSIRRLRPFRKWAWAISVSGIVGCIGEVLRFAFA